MKEGIHINSKIGFSYLKVTFSLLFDSDLCMLQLINTTANQVWRTIIVLCLFIIQNKMFYSRALVSLLLCMGLHLCFTYNNFSLHQSWETGIIMKIYIKSVVTVWGNWSPERKKFENTWLEIHGGWVPALSFRSLFLPFCYI